MSVDVGAGRRAVCAFVVGLAACGGEDIPSCPAGELEASLLAATPGTTVELGACRAEGRFRIPVGVTLRGRGPDASIIVSSETAIELVGDATIEGLRIEHGAGHGIGSIGAGSVTIRNVDIASTLGRAAIGIAEAGTVSIADVTLIGPVLDETIAERLPAEPTETDAPLYGIVLVNVASASLERVTVTGYALAGVASGASMLVWRDGDASSNLGMGVWIDAGDATLENVTITDTLRGFRGVPTYGLLSTRMATLRTQGVSIRTAHQGIGALHETGSVTHVSLVSEGHAAGGVVAQQTTAFALMGASRLADNEMGGLLAVEAGGLMVDDVRIERSRSVARMVGDWGSVNIGDGVQLVAPPPGSVVRNLTLEGNERAGILMDLGGGDTSSVALTSVTANANGAAYGAVVQNGTAVAGWDASVTRGGAAPANDPAFTGGLDVISVLGGTSFPDPGSLTGIVVPCD